MTKEKYYRFVTVSDEAFAFLVLENNEARYLDMADESRGRKGQVITILVL